MSKARGATVDTMVKLIVGAGQASPSPPVGPALGSKGVKSMDFCKVRVLCLSGGRMPRKCTALTARSGIQRKNSTHQPRHAVAHAGGRPPRPIVPLRGADTTDIMAAPQRC